ncbi:HD domain-containing protein [Candidatus Bathyarchaeota archaeon]|nr:HD domain-containing protein [Candidatus Bathyarchaeota archaeon]
MRHQELNGCHGYEHTERVIRLCTALGEKLGADMDVLIPAAILHDVGRGGEDHAARGAKKAIEILREAGLDEARIDAIAEAIRVHSFSGSLGATSLEAQILSDADKLDAMGAVGVYRGAQYSGEHGRPLERFVGHFHEKLLKLRELLYTEEARRMAERRHEFMLRYLEEFMNELEAES